MSEPFQQETFDQSIKPDRMQVVQRQLLILVLALIALLLAFQLSIFFADILRILIFSILSAYMFINVVDFLERVTRNRAVSILLVYAVAGVVSVIGIIWFVPAVIYQISQLLSTAFNSLPQLIQELETMMRPLENRLHAAQIQVRAIDILTNIATSIPKPDPSLIIARFTDVAMSTMTWLFYGLSIIVIAFYFLLDGHTIKEGVIRTFPHRHYVSLMLLATDIDLSIQAFFRGQIVLGMGFGGLMFCVYWAMGIHYALLLGLILGLWEIVPVIGPTIGFIPTLVSVALDGMDTVHVSRIWQIVIVIVVVQLFQWLKDNVVAPRYIGNVIGLHPVLIFLAIMIGARLDGMAGVICSLPVACVINVYANHQIARVRASKLMATQSYLGVPANARAAALMKEIGC